jgi:hypothetical protein
MTKAIIKNGLKAGQHPWLMPVILATWEAEIRRITAQGWTGKKAIHCLKNTQHKKGLAEWLKW